MVVHVTGSIGLLFVAMLLWGLMRPERYADQMVDRDGQDMPGLRYWRSYGQQVYEPPRYWTR